MAAIPDLLNGWESIFFFFFLFFFFYLFCTPYFLLDYLFMLCCLSQVGGFPGGAVCESISHKLSLALARHP